MERSQQSSSRSYKASPSKMARWLVMGMVALVIMLGLAFRIHNLGQKAYWVDEVHTAVRIAGYTKADITAEQFDNQVHAVTDLNAYQIPTTDPSLRDVLNTLAQHPEHPPLYYLLARWWMQGAIALGIQPSVTVTRSLSLLFSFLTLPCVVGLVRELFRSKLTAIVALSIFALSPLHILYGQEAREYSLWTLVTLLSCWTLLRAIRLPSLKNWVVYGITLTIGWYSHLLFTTVAIAHTLYFFLFAASAPTPATATPATATNATTAHHSQSDEVCDDALRFANASYSTSPDLLFSSKIFFPLTLAISLFLFVPWIAVFLNQLGQVQAVVDATQRDPSLGYLINVWGRNLSRVWVSGDLGSVNLIWVLGVGYGLVYLWRTMPTSVAGFLLLIIGVNALPLMVSDALTGGISSTRIRYLLPAYSGIQLAIAHLFAHHIAHSNKPYITPQPSSQQTQAQQTQAQQSVKTWIKQGWNAGLLVLLISGAIAGCVNAPQRTNWAKSDKSLYYPQMAAIINASNHPLVITDNSATYTLVLAHQLNDHVHIQLMALQQLQRPKDLVIPNAVEGETITDLFLFAPSPPLRRQVERLVEKRSETHGENKRFGAFSSVVRQSDRFQLLQSESLSSKNKGLYFKSVFWGAKRPKTPT